MTRVLRHARQAGVGLVTAIFLLVVLAGLGVAAVILQTVVGLCVFLAYGTTASVARHLGAGDLRGALAQGVDGVWLAILIGTVATVGGILLTPALVAVFDTGSEVAGHAETYLAIAFLGTTPLLVMLAATGVLRGLQDTRTPLLVAVVGNGLNIVLNVVLVYGFGLGIAGSAIGSVLAQGVDGLWLAVIIGAVATVTGVLATRPLVAAFDTGAEVAGHAETYLAIAFLGTTPLLVMLAATGVLRGLQDTRTPLLVAVVGNGLNIALNLLLVYGLDLGIAGSAIGSVIAQVVSAGWLVAVVVRAAREHDAPLTPDIPGIRAAAHAAVALVIRTLALRACLLVGTYAVTRVGTDSRDVTVATHQVAITLWTFLAFALDAIAIAAQALTGRSLGSGDVETTRVLTRRMIQWGWGSGLVAGLALAAVSPVIGAVFTDDPAVQDMLVPVLLVAAVGQPLAGVVFMGARALLLWRRARGDRWLVTGATLAR